jgi:protein gp37
MARRLAGRFGYPEAPDHFDVTLHSDRLEDPLRWRKPRTVFVCSMGDLFHEDVPMEYVGRVFDVMSEAREHTFQVLTKRPKRMLEYAEEVWKVLPTIGNIWWGVTAENQQQANKRIPILLQIPATVRFVSAEPMLGPIRLDPYRWFPYDYYKQSSVLEQSQGRSFSGPPRLDWVIVGGESGLGARPMHPDWVRSVRDQCVDAGVPFFFKQWGCWIEDDEGLNWEPGNEDRFYLFDDGTQMYPVGKKAAGRKLDGREWNEWPE